MIEQYGSGVGRRVDACLDTGLPEPDFANFSGGFRVLFSQKGMKKPDGKTSEKGSEKGSEKSSEKIMQILSRKPDTSAVEIALALKISPRAVEKHLAKLKKLGTLKRIGPDKGGHWKVVDTE